MSDEKKKKDIHTADSEEHVLEGLLAKLHDSNFLDDDDYKKDLDEIQRKKD